MANGDARECSECDGKIAATDTDRTVVHCKLTIINSIIETYGPTRFAIRLLLLYTLGRSPHRITYVRVY